MEKKSDILFEVRVLGDVAGELSHIANALRVVGNDKLSNDLHDLADIITNSAREIKTAHFNEIDGRLADTNEVSGTLLSLILKMGDK